MAGERAYALISDLVLLERAVHSYALDLLRDKDFTLVSVPSLVREEALIGTGMFPAHREEIYAIPADDLYLAGTAEVALVGFHSDEILDHRQLPIRYAGISPCFRREAGSAGRDVRGLLRVHQFEKVEQFVICAADLAESDRWHAELLGTAEQLLQGLGLAYEVMEVSTGDMGAGKYRMNDINTWMPSLGAYRETHSCSSLLDWQARRANVRYRDADGTVRFAYTLNNTAVATPRILAALVENFQTEQAQVIVPAVLRPYLGRAPANCSKLRGVNLDADRVAELAARPLSDLTRRDVALALLTVPSADALGSLPGIRRGLLAAGNPLSAVFWSSAEAILHKINDSDATVGDVRTWLEATGTEPNGIIGLHVWDDQSERSQLAAEMHTRLVSHLEDRLAAGEIDPDLLVAADPAACRAYIAVQERWMTSPLPDGRVPMDVLLDEKDEEFLAEWDAADAEALAAIGELLDQVGDRPLPADDLRAAAGRLREYIARPGWPGAAADRVRRHARGGPARRRRRAVAPARHGRGVAGGVGRLGPEDEGELNETDSAIAAICAIDHFDWLAVITALAVGGPGTSASAADLAGYVRDYDPDGAEQGEEDEDDFDLGDLDEDGEFDELGMEGLFLPVTSLWQVLGAIDDEDCLTPLGWWGLPEAMRRVWAPSGSQASRREEPRRGWKPAGRSLRDELGWSRDGRPCRHGQEDQDGSRGRQ